MANNRFQIKIEGIEDVKKIFAQLPKEINERVQLDINKASAKIAAKQLEQDAPSGDNDKSNKQKIENNVVVARKRKSKTGVAVGFARPAFHVRFYEFGTDTRETEKGANRGEMPANPFVQKSFDKSAPDVVRYFQDNYLRLMNRSIKKYAKRFSKK